MGARRSAIPEVETRRRAEVTARRVLFVGKNHLPYVGGSEVSTHHLAVCLQAAGDEVSVLTRLPRRSLVGSLAWAADGLGGRLPPRLDLSLGYPTRRVHDPVAAVGAVASETAADVVVVTCGDPRFARACLNAATDRPGILYVRDARSAEVAGSTIHADVVVANSSFTARCVRLTGRDATFLPSLFPRSTYEVQTRREKVLFVNPTPRKGIAIAFGIASARPDIPIVIRLSWRMRRGALRDVRERARALGNVELRAATSDPGELYGDCRLVLVPSMDEEAWCRVVSEAQVNGIPSIASALGGLPESVGGGGILVDARAPLDAWIRALAEAWDDESRYEELSVRALQHSRRDELDPETVTRRFRSLVDEAIARHSEHLERARHE